MIIYSGIPKPINSTEAWHNTLAFSDFSKIQMQIGFQNAYHAVTFWTKGGDTIIQEFSFTAFNPSDSGCRIIAGKLKFAGRYITEAGVVMSLNLGAFTQLSADNIYVSQIIGYK